MGFWHDHDTIAITDLNAYQRNIRAICSYIGPSVRLMAVVKANAYGHGMVPCGLTALASGASMLAVAFSSEGAELRKAGVESPILVMAQESPAHTPTLLENNLTGTLTSREMLAEIERWSRHTGRPCHVHIKVDTGMGRIGAAPDEAVALARAAARSRHVLLVGVFTHFSSAVVENDPLSLNQIELFQGFIDQLARDGIDPGIVHMCNSAGILNYPGAFFTMVRPGIMTYGLEVLPGCSRKLALEPVLTFKSRVSFLKEVPAGFRVSYGGTFITSRRSRLATVPVGYSYGYNRKLSNRGRAIINGTYVPVAGRICMDQTVFDVTDAGPVRVGDEITLIGQEGSASVSVEEHALIGDTINYEIITGISGRVYRVIVPAE